MSTSREDLNRSANQIPLLESNTTSLVPAPLFAWFESMIDCQPTGNFLCVLINSVLYPQLYPKCLYHIETMSSIMFLTISYYYISFISPNIANDITR